MVRCELFVVIFSTSTILLWIPLGLPHPQPSNPAKKERDQSWSLPWSHSPAPWEHLLWCFATCTSCRELKHYIILYYWQLEGKMSGSKNTWNSLKIYINARTVFRRCWALLHTWIRSLSFMFLRNHQDKSWHSPQDLCLKETEHQSTTAQSPTTQSQELALVVFPLLHLQLLDRDGI